MARAQRSHAFRDADRSCRTGGCRHETPCEGRDELVNFLLLFRALAPHTQSVCLHQNGSETLVQLEFEGMRILAAVSFRIRLIPQTHLKPYHSFWYGWLKLEPEIISGRNAEGSTALDFSPAGFLSDADSLVGRCRNLSALARGTVVVLV